MNGHCLCDGVACPSRQVCTVTGSNTPPVCCEPTSVICDGLCCPPGYTCIDGECACPTNDCGGGSSSLPGSIRGAVDPNDLVGSLGFGPQRWVAATDTLPFTIFFENKESASADAADVVVAGHLDTASLDLTTLQLGVVSFGDTRLTPSLDNAPPVGRRQFNAEADLRPAKNLKVTVNASLDILTGEMTWHFVSLDPDTNQPPTDLRGFLPPGGQGDVSFTVQPRKEAPTGTVTTSKATITFDGVNPLDTPSWANTIDSAKPTSHVKPLAAQQESATFLVAWEVADIGAGMRDVTILVSDNNGPFTPWLINTTQTEATFLGTPGHTYGFKSSARDNVFNVEDEHPQPDAVTKIADAATDVTSQVAIKLGGFRKSRLTGRYQQEAQITNTSKANITGPLSLVCDGLISGVTLFQATGVTKLLAPLGSSYKDLNAAGAPLKPGATLKAVLEFTNPKDVAITYSPRAIAGPGGR